MNHEVIASLQHASLGFQGRTVLTDLTVEIRTGEMIALVGPNGSGKTTMLKSLLGLIPLLKGKRTLLGKENPPAESFPGQISYVPQKLEVNHSIPLTVLEFLKLKGGDKNILAKVELQGFENHHLKSLSSGQLQRVFLAFALLGQCRLIALDEATEGLDYKSEQSFLELLCKTVRDSNRTAIFISHDISAVTDHATRVICLDGHVTYDGDPKKPEFHNCLHQIYGSHAVIHGH